MVNDQVLSNKKDSIQFYESFFKVQNEQILVQTSIKKSVNLKNHKSNILLYLTNSHSGFFRNEMIFQLIRNLTLVMKSILKNRNAILGSSKYVEGKILYFLIKKCHLNVKVVCTQTELLSLPGIYYFNEEKNNAMIWYSDNSLPILRSSYPSNLYFDLSYLNQPKVGTHYVWTETFAKILRKFNHNSKIEIIKPFSFFHYYPLLKNNHIRYDKSKFKIVYFPITPYSSTIESNIYSAKNLSLDLNIIIDEVNRFNTCNKQVELYVKPKRAFDKTHSQEYTKMIFKHLRNKKIKLIEHSKDVIDLCREMDLIICTPFTSVALIAKYLGKNTIYFSSLKDLIVSNGKSRVPVVYGQKQLNGYLKKCLTD
jgi:polysaccharide biosynthesis PFTS motif protein